MSETEIEHSRLIIQELLEVLINANEMGLEISEIEGDAILFYKFGESPDLPSLYKQVEKMFCEFHRNLFAYEYRRFCQCNACIKAVDLTLKIITHYGEFTGYQVKTFNKLIGKDIIVAHQLLKNDIGDHEYWLVTDQLLPGAAPADLTQCIEWNSSVKQTESGAIPFHYAQLGRLKDGLTPDPLPELELQKKVKQFSVTAEYDADIITMFHATGDFNYRSQWQEGVKKVEEVNHFLPRVGMRCRCVMENGESVIFSSTYSFHPDRIQFSETDDKKESAVYYLLEKKSDKQTKLTIDFYLKKNIAGEIIFRLLKKRKKEAGFRKSLLNLAELAQRIKLPS